MTAALARTSLSLAVLSLVACGTRSVPGTPNKPSADPPDAAPARVTDPPLLKVSVVELQIDGAQIWLSVTNEVGASDLIEVGSFAGACSDDVDTTGDPVPVEGAVFAVECTAQDGSGVRLRFLRRDPQLVVVRAPAGSDQFEVYRSLDLPQSSRLVFE